MTKLQKLRKDKGLKQVQVTDKADITVMSYYRYESGKRRPDVYTAQRIALALDTTVDDLFPLQSLERVESR